MVQEEEGGVGLELGSEGCKGTYSDFEIHGFLGKGAHIVVKAEPEFAGLFRGEDEIPLALLGGFHDCFFVGPYDAIVNVKGTARLDLVAQEIHQSRCNARVRLDE